MFVRPRIFLIKKVWQAASMQWFLTSLALAIISVLWWPKLPPLLLGYGAFLLGFSLLLLKIVTAKETRATYSRISLCFAGILLGVGWSTLYTYHQINHRLAANQTILAQGHLFNIPEVTPYGTRFEFIITKIISSPGSNLALPITARLTWSGKFDPLYPNDQWQLRLRLKPPQSIQNPYTFDQTKWLFANHIQALGTVIMSPANVQIGKASIFSIDRFRQKIANRITQTLEPQTNFIGFITALVVGVRTAITPTQWLVLRNTGTNHLMAIAGLHLGFVALISYFLVRQCCNLYPPLYQYHTAPQIMAIGALAVATLYSTLAGFALPTQRALSMYSVFLIFLMLRRYLPPWRSWLIAMTLILLLDPLSSLSESFWLSFTAVGFIIYGMSGRLRTGKYQHWWKIQWLITVGLMPLMLLFFQQFSLGGLIANFIAIPWVGFLILPLCLLGALMLFIYPLIGTYLLQLATILFTPLWFVLCHIAAIQILQWHTLLQNPLALVALFLAVLLILAPRALPGRYLAFIFLLPLFFPYVKPVRANELQLHLFDTKQGLLAVVETQQHSLIYSSLNLKLAQPMIDPYLQSRHIKKVDLTLTPQSLPNQAWQWDGINFSYQFSHKDSLLQIKTPIGITISSHPNLINSNIPILITTGRALHKNLNLLQPLFIKTILLAGGWEMSRQDRDQTRQICRAQGITCYITADSGAITLSQLNQTTKISEYNQSQLHVWS